MITEVFQQNHLCRYDPPFRLPATPLSGYAVNELSEAIQFCTTFLENPGVLVPDACVIDVGFIQGKGWAIIECNAAWSSGVYGCDGAGVLSVLRRACRPDR